MSREIDERVVQMKFEKGKFEKEIQTSIYKLDELKKGLDFKDAVKGFDDLDRAARSTDISALGKAVEQVQLKFGLLEVFALNVMNRISNAAIDAGEKLVKSLTIDQITPGWDKYAQKTSSVQTIMAATAKQFSDTAVQMEVVNAQLDKLNWFTDETSYNFVDMVNNIGKFTSNNIALDQSVTAMQGIANWAAISGANAQEASRAMYNLAQALATGSVKLIDWKSIENANMATTEFKQTVIDIATEMGTLIKVADDAWTTIDGKTQVSVANFNEGLSKGWFTNDVLMKGLNKYGAAAEKLNEIYETLGAEVTTSRIVSSIEKYTKALDNARKEAVEFGLGVEETNEKVAKAGEAVAAEVAESWGISLEEATKMLAEFDDETMQFGLKAFKAAQEAKTFQEAIDSVKDAVSTGWMKTFELMFGNYTEAKELWTNLANTLYDIFAASGDVRNEMLKEWAAEGGRAYFTDTIYASLAAIMSILTPIKAAWEAVFGRMTAKTLLDITKRLHAFTLNLVQSEESMDKIARVFRGLFSILDIAKTVITGAIKGGFGVLQRVLAELNIDAGEFAATIGDGLFALRNWVKQGNAIPIIFEKIGDALIWVIKEARNFINTIKEFGPIKTIIEGVQKMFGEDFQGIGGILTAVGNTFLWLWSQLSAFKMPTSLNDIFQFFKDFWDAIKTNFKEIGLDFTWVEELFANFGTTVQNTLGSVNTAFTTTTGVIGAAIKYLGKIFAEVDWSGVLLAAFGVGTLAILWKFTEALQEFAKAFGNVTKVGKSAQGALDSIRDYFKALKQNIQTNNILKMAVAVTALAIAFGLLAKLEWNQVGKGAIAIGSIGVVLLGLTAVMAGLNKLGFNANGFSTFILSLAASITLLSVALQKIPYTQGDNNELNARLWAVLELVGIVSVAALALSAIAKVAPINTSNLLALAGSIYILVLAMKSIGEQDLVTIYAATPVIIILMGALAALSYLLNFTKVIEKDLGGGIKKTTKNGGAFSTVIGLVFGLILLIQAIKILGKMDPSVATQGIILAIPMMALLSALFKASAKAGKEASSAGKMILFIAAGLALLIPVVKAFANMELGLLARGGAAVIALSTLIALPLVALSKFAGKYAAKAGLMILEIAGALAIIQLVVKTLGKIDFLTLSKGTAAVGILIVAFSVVLKSLAGLGKGANESNVKAMTKIMVIMAIISSLVLLLTIINPDGALAVTVGLSALFLSLGQMFKVMNGIKLPDWKSLGALISIIGMIGLTIGLVAAITDWQNALGAAAGMSLVILALASVSQILKNSATTDAMLGKLIILRRFAMYMALVLAALAAGALIYTKVFHGNITDLLGVTTAMSELIIAFGLMGKLIGKLSLPTARQLNQVALFATEMSGIILAIGAILALGNHFNLDISNILLITTAMTELMIAMAVSIRIMSGTKLNTDFKAGIPQAGAMGVLIAAIGATLGYFSGMTDPNSVLPLALGMSAVVLAVAAAAVILAKFPSGGFVAAIKGIGIALIIVAGIAALMWAIGSIVQDNTIFDRASEALLYIGQGIRNFFGGIISGLANGVISFLPLMTDTISQAMHNLMPFFDDLQNIPGGALGLIGTLTAIVAAMTAAEFMSGLKLIPGLGAILAVGSATIVNDFRRFGLALKAFSDSVEGVDGPNVKAAAEALVALAGLEQHMGGIKGLFNSLIDSIFGDDNLEAFGERLAKLGECLIGFAEKTKDLDTDIVDKAAACAQTLMALEKNLPPRDGVLQKFLGQDGFDQFGERLRTLGWALYIFSWYGAMVDYEATENARKAAETLVDLENTLEPVNGLTGLIFGKKELDGFGERLVSFAQALVDFSTTINGTTFDVLKVATVCQITRMLSDVEKDLDTTGGAKSFWFGDNSFATFGENLTTFGNKLIGFSSQIATLNFDGMWKAIDYIHALIGLQDLKYTQDDAIKAAQTILDDIKKTIENNQKSMRANGVSAMYWLAKGLSDGTSIHSKTVEDAAISMANIFIASFEAALKIHSPSLVMNEEGHWVVKGLAEGITQETAAEEAAKKKAQNLVSAFESELSKLTSKEKTSSLEFQLWQLTDGKGATEVEIAQKQLELENEKLANLAKAVSAKQVAMEAIAEMSGKDSAEYQSAYQDYLQAQIDMLNQQQAIDTTYHGTTSLTDPKQQMQAFAAYMKEYKDTYEFLGKSQEELEEAAYKAVYGLDAEAVARKRQYEQVMIEYEETFNMLGKSRDELDTFAKEKTGWQGLASNVNSTMSETAKIIEDNIHTYSLDLEATLEMATAEIITNSTKSGSAASSAASSAGAGLGGDLAGSFTNTIQQALGGEGGTAFDGIVDSGKTLLDKIMEMWGGEFSIGGTDLSSIFSSNLISGLTEQTQPIADAFSNMIQNGIDTSGISDLVKEYGGDTVMGFAEGILDQAKRSEIVQAIQSAITDPTKDTIRSEFDINSPSKVAYDYGAYFTEGFANGLVDPKVVSMVEENINKALASLQEALNTMTDTGRLTLSNYADGFSDSDIIQRIKNTAILVSTNAKTPFSDSVPEYQTIAIYAMQGFTQGIQTEGQKAIQAALEIATQVATIMRSTLQVNSPSRITRAIGESVGEGMALGIVDSTPGIMNAVDKMADNTVSSLNYAAQAINAIINSDDDFRPVITPILDMDEVKKQASGIPGLLNSDRRISVNSARIRVAQISADSGDQVNQNGSKDGSSQTNYNFTQNNYSPKALSRVEIYRQTNNQFSRIKEATKR